MSVLLKPKHLYYTNKGVECLNAVDEIKVQENYTMKNKTDSMEHDSEHLFI